MPFPPPGYLPDAGIKSGYLVLHTDSLPSEPPDLFSVCVCVCVCVCVYMSQVAQMVKNLPAMRETWIRSLGWEDPLEEGMATHSSILAWRIATDREVWQATVCGVTESDKTERLSTAGIYP